MRAFNQAGEWVHDERSADNDEQIALFKIFRRASSEALGQVFAEKHNIRFDELTAMTSHGLTSVTRLFDFCDVSRMTTQAFRAVKIPVRCDNFIRRQSRRTFKRVNILREASQKNSFIV